MSAAILVSQTWQPTVLQLMPFSSNNASAATHRSDGSGKTRDFPTLAVTRSHDDWVAHMQASSTVQRTTSERMPRSHYNQPTGRQTFSKRAQSEYKPRERHKPESTLEKTCSVNDLNNKIMHCANQERESSSVLYNGSVLLSEIHGASKPLQNHTSQRAWEGHYYLPQNGFWRAMTLTPGEIDLQKHRDIMNKEQVKKTKKLNINQLPRSNTPINDNDPDKLNMHQVIQFLRTHNDANDDSKEKHLEKTKPEKDKDYFLKKRGCVSASVEAANRQRKSIHSKPIDATTSASRTAITASTRSSPILRGRLSKQMRDEPTESKPAWESDSSGSHKQFRLHRFLKVTPTCAESSHTMNRSYTQVPSHILKTVEINNQINLPRARPDMYRIDPTLAPQKGVSTTVDRHCRLAYRLPAKRSSAKSVYKNEISRSAVGSAKSNDHSNPVGNDGAVIRLPSMYDFKTDSDNDSDTGDSRQTRTQKEHGLILHDNQSMGSLSVQTRFNQSTESLITQTGHNSQSAENVTIQNHRNKSNESLTSQTYNDNQSIGSPSVPNRHENQSTRIVKFQTNKMMAEPFKPSCPAHLTVQCQNEVKPPKKLCISVPRETFEDVVIPKPSDCVKLSLRQERCLTREKSYMTDLGKSKCGHAEQRKGPQSTTRTSIGVENKMEKDEDDLSSRTS